MHISVTWLTPHLQEHIGQSHQCTFICTHEVHVNVQRPVCLTCACKCAGCQTIGSLHIFMHTSVIRPTAYLHERIRQSDHCTATSTHQVHVNVQRPECVTCACKCAETQTIGSQHIFMHTSLIGLTAQLSNTSDSRIYMHVNVQWPECLTCACKCAESQTIGSLHIFIHALVIVPTAILHEHIRQSVHFTFTRKHQVHVNVQWPEWLTCACKCAESHTIGSLNIFMHTSIIGPTAQLHECIRQSDHCKFTSIHQVHENVQWPECLTCACKCEES